MCLNRFKEYTEIQTVYRVLEFDDSFLNGDNFLQQGPNVPNDKILSFALVVAEGIMRDSNGNRMYHK